MPDTPQTKTVKTIKTPENLTIIIENNNYFQRRKDENTEQDKVLTPEIVARRRKIEEIANLDKTSIKDQVSYNFSKYSKRSAKTGAALGSAIGSVAAFVIIIALSVMFVTPAIVGTTILGMTIAHHTGLVLASLVGALVGGSAFAPAAVIGATIGALIGTSIGGSYGIAKGTVNALTAKKQQDADNQKIIKEVAAQKTNETNTQENIQNIEEQQTQIEKTIIKEYSTKQAELKPDNVHTANENTKPNNVSEKKDILIQNKDNIPKTGQRINENNEPNSSSIGL